MWPFSRSAKITEAHLNAAIDTVRAQTQSDAVLAIREAAASAEAILTAEDKGWSLASAGDGGLLDQTRRATVAQAEKFATIDPMCKQIVALWTNFGVGAGVTWGVVEENEKAGQVLDDFANDPRNAVVMSRQGQRRSSDRLVTHGEIFFAMFGDQEIKIRWLNPLQMDIASDPEDKWTPRYYRRSWHDKGGEHKAYYRDYQNIDNAGGVLPDGTTVTEDMVASDAPVVYHVAIQTTGTRGNSVLTATIPWCAIYRAFMQNRVAIERALAVFAWVGKSKGTQAQVSALAGKLDTTLDSSGAETNPPPVAGSTLWTNDATSLTAQKQETGASAAQIDGNMIMQLIGVSAGIFPHYLGAGEAFKLATATAMEPPMARTFNAYRVLWHDIYRNIFGYVLRQSGVSKDGREVTVDSPEVFPEQTERAVDALSKLLAHFPGFLASKTVQQRALGVMGMEDPAAVLTALEDVDTEASLPEARSKLLGLLRDAQAVKGGT